jgi:P4 family phage/plasmid primase-like protien
MLEWAQRYIKLGWPVFPCSGKEPLVEHGLSEASINPAQVENWWKKWPRANIGVVTGGRFFVLDIDLNKDGEETWDSLRHKYGLKIPDTLQQLTGSGGRHILFAMPGFPVKNSVSRIGAGLDIRGVGGYIVAPPSIHPVTKREYSWDCLDEFEKQPIAPAPAWLLTLIQEAEGRRQAPTQIPEQITKGGRNDKLFRVGAGLRARGFTAEEIFASLKVLNGGRCNPPLDEAEVRTIAESAAKYKPGLFGVGPRRPSGEEEAPLGQDDIEKAVDAMIARNDLLGAMNLAGDVAKLPPVAMLLAKTKLRMHFGKDWRAGDFDDALRLLRSGRGDPQPAGANVVQMPFPPGDGVRAPGPHQPDLLGYPLTDSGNGERIVALFGKEMRYCIEMKKWLMWDGQRWAIDEKSEATQRAKIMARELYLQAIGDERRSKWARTSESRASIMAALDRAASEPGIPISADRLDAHQYLLNCRNGVVDLRTGELVPHDREYLITKLCDVDYDPEAQCPRFLKFIQWAMGDCNPEADPTVKTTRLVAFLQKAFGYGLTGDVSEKCVFVFWGSSGDNGKTTLLNVFTRLLREYSAQIDINTLMASRMLDAAMRADLASLRGARFVTTSEVESGSQLGEAKLKYITAGMGKIKTCRKYENPIEFEQSHKLFMDCNYRPKVRGTDDAIWQRLKSIPFEIKIDRASEEFDPKLIEKLEAEFPGILAWAVRGCKAWRADGLGAPPEIADANAEWREADDPLRDFLEDCCEVDDPEGSVRSSLLSHAYAWWCQENREMRPLGRVAFAERLRSKGFGYSRSSRDASGKQMRTWKGISLRTGIEVEVEAAARSGHGRRLFGDD